MSSARIPLARTESRGPPGRDIQLDAQEGEEMEFGEHGAAPSMAISFRVDSSWCSPHSAPCGHSQSLVLSSDLVTCPLPSASCLSTPLAPSLPPQTSCRDVFLRFSHLLPVLCSPTRAAVRSHTSTPGSRSPTQLGRQGLAGSFRHAFRDYIKDCQTPKPPSQPSSP